MLALLIKYGDSDIEIGCEGAPEEVGKKHPEGGFADFVADDDECKHECPHNEKPDEGEPEEI